MSKNKRRVVVCCPAFGGQLSNHFVTSILETQLAMIKEGISFSVLIIANESLISRGRNKCAQMAMAGKFTDLFFIDADIGWKWQDFLKILKSPNHVVGGTYSMKMLPINLNYNLLPEDRALYQRSHIKSKAILEQMIEDKGKEEIEVQHVPTGFMRISVTALERLKHKVDAYKQQNPRTGEIEDYWDLFPVRVKDGNLMSEDWMFCELCRENGIPVFMNLSVINHHIGSFDFWEAE